VDTEFFLKELLSLRDLGNSMNFQQLSTNSYKVKLLTGGMSH